MSQPPHKQTQPLMRSQCQAHFMQGIQHDPMLVKRSGIRTVPLPTPCGIGIVWDVHLSNHQHPRREELVTMTIYSRLMACPRCNCQMQVGAQVQIKRTRAGVTVSPKRIDIVRVPVGSQMLRHTRIEEHDICEPLTYYILVKVHIGGTASRETYWKVTV